MVFLNINYWEIIKKLKKYKRIKKNFTKNEYHEKNIFIF